MGNKRFHAGIAQLVEQRTENPRVTSSSLVPGILYKVVKKVWFSGVQLSDTDSNCAATIDKATIGAVTARKIRRPRETG